MNINIEFRKGLLFIRPIGFINKITYNKLDDLLNYLIDKNGFKYIVLNFSKLKGYKKEESKIIISCYYDLIMKNGKLIVCGLNNKLITSLIDEISIKNSELDAFKIMSI